MSIELLDLGAEGLDGLKEITSFYDQYSHVSALGVANLTMMESEGVVLGSSFDPAKLEIVRHGRSDDRSGFDRYALVGIDRCLVGAQAAPHRYAVENAILVP